MAGFGGAVKLTGESEYRKALSQITQSLKVVSAEMKATSSSYSAGAKSEQELAQSAESLSKALNTQKTALASLKSQLATMQADYNKTGASHQELLKKYDAEKAKLDEIGKTLGTSSQEYKDQEKVVTELAQEVTKSEKAYDAQGKAINDMRIKTANAETTCNQTADALDNLGKEAEDSGKKAEKGGEGFTVFKAVLANLATQVITSAINGLKDLGATVLDVGKQAVEGFAEFEQLEGGVKKLFGEETSKTVIENANKAFSTAGMSANEYMDTVTSFSASLISGLGGDTEKASQIADVAIRDMADNANTFGTSMESIQNAYQGFAKGNYTMLDNLKLGYGGTKEEMLRLVKDAGVVNDSVKSIDEVSFDQIITAINKTQERMNITGTTAKEASSTIEGSTASMKSAWQNMLTGMADENANFETLASDFIGTLITPDGQGGVLGTLVPRITQVITGMSNAISTLLPQLIQSVVPIIEQNLPVILNAVTKALTTILKLLPKIMPVIAKLIPQIVQTLVKMLPQIIDTGVKMILSLIQGLTKALPQLIKMLPKIIKTIADVLIKNLPLIITTGIDLILALIEGLSDAIPQLIKYIPQIVQTITEVLINNLPKIIESAIKIMVALIKGLTQALPQLVAMIPKIISTIVSTLANNLPKILQSGGKILSSLVQGIGKKIGDLKKKAHEVGQAFLNSVKEFPSKMLSVGKNLVEGIWNGISNGLGWIKGKISGWVGNVTSFIKSLFGIKSPSTVMKEQVGKNIALGIINGIDEYVKKGKKKIKKSMEQLSKDIVSSAKSRVSELRKANQLAETDEVNFWETIVKKVKKGTRAYKTAMSNLAKAKNDLKKDVSAVSKTFVEEVQKVNTELEKNISALKTAYAEAVTKRKEEIVSSLNLFEAVKYDEEVSKNDLLKNLKEQVKALRKWDDTLDALKKKIKNSDLLAELEKQGIGALPVLEQINSMSKAELAEYEKLYKKKADIAKERAEAENEQLLQETNAQIETLKKNADKQIESLKTTYLKNLKALGVEGNKESKKVGKLIASGISSGFSAGMKSVTKATKEQLNAMLTEIKKQLKIKSPSQVYEDEIGDNLAKGIGVGFENEMKAVTQQMKNAIPTSFDVSSSVAGSRYTSNRETDMVTAFKEALSQVKIVLDDEVAGEFVEKTVTRVIYA